MKKNRKTLIENNLTLFQSEDIEVRNLIINLLFPHELNLTLKFKTDRKYINNFIADIITKSTLSVIDKKTNIEILNNTHTEISDNYYTEYYLLAKFCSKFNIHGNFDNDILGEIVNFDINFDLLTEYSVDIIFDRSTDNYKIFNYKIISKVDKLKLIKIVYE